MNRALADQAAALDERAEAMIATVEQWSAINSGSYEPDGLARMAEALEAAFEALPGRMERIRLPQTARIRPSGEAETIEHGHALRVRVRPDAPVRLALTGHYDTVFPASSPFQRMTRLPDGRLNGPGVADMKGGLLVMLEALKAFEATPEARAIGYDVLLSPDEEIGSPASAPLLAELGAGARMGMTYEPALPDGAIVSSRKGSGNFALVARGRAAHVGRAFEDGRNAVLALAEVALRLDRLNGARAGVTLNVAAIEGGAPLNMVPAAAVLRFNLRSPDASSADWALAEIEAAAASSPRADVTLSLHGGVTRAAKPITPAQEALFRWTRAAGADLGLDLSFVPSGGVCEGNNLAAAGCPNIDTLGPRGGALHSPDEFALPDSFAERAKLSLMLLHGVASGRFDLRELAA